MISFSHTLSPVLRRPHALFAIFFCACLLADDSRAQDSPLTLEQAQCLAVSHSHLLSVQDRATLASQEMAHASDQLPDPVVKLGVDNYPVSGAGPLNLTGDSMTMQRVGIMQEITRADKRHARSDLFSRAAEKAQIEKQLALLSIERESAIVWLERFYREQMAANLAQQLAQVRLEIQTAASNYRSGRGSQAELIGAKSTLALLEDRASDMDQQVAMAGIALARWTGQESTLATTPPPDSVALDPDRLEQQLLEHPQLALFDKDIQIADADVSLAKANRQADWSVELTYQQRGQAYGNMVSVGVSIPLQWGQRQNHELVAKLAALDLTRDTRAERLREQVAQTRTLLSQWNNNRTRIVRYEQELLPLAEQQIAAQNSAYRGGKASLNELLAARRNAMEMRQQLLQLQLDTARLWAQLQFLAPQQHITSASVIDQDTP